MAKANFSLGEAVLATKADLSGLDHDLDAGKGKAKSWLGGLGDIFKVGIGTAIGHAITGGINLLIDAVGKIGGAFSNLGQQMIGGNAQFEVFQTKLGVLLGSSEAAQKRINELATFAAKTPFEIPDVVEASTILQNFGGDALATGKGLQFVGDLASGANVPFKEMAVTVGRLFSAIQSGKPFGEAAMRLQELGIASGTDMDILKQMQEDGASAADIWKKFTEQTGKFSGMMDKQSLTFEGMSSNLSDWFNTMMRTIGAPLFDIAKQGLGRLLEILGSPDMKIQIDALASNVGLVAQAFMQWAGPALDTLMTKLPDIVALASDFIQLFAGGDLMAVAEDLDGIFGGTTFQDILLWFQDASAKVNDLWIILSAFGDFLGREFAIIGAAFAPVFEKLGMQMDATGGKTISWQDILSAVAGFISTVLVPVIVAMVTFITDDVIPTIDFLIDLWIGFKKGIEGIELAVRSVTQFIQHLVDILKLVVIPPALTPGSPTPFEMGLRGVARAMKEVNRLTPDMLNGDVSFNRQLSLAVSGAGSGKAMNIYGDVHVAAPRDSSLFDVLNQLEVNRKGL